MNYLLFAAAAKTFGEQVIGLVIVGFLFSWVFRDVWMPIFQPAAYKAEMELKAAKSRNRRAAAGKATGFVARMILGRMMK